MRARSGDVADAVVRALVLYSLAEFQSGNATTIRVYADGLRFRVADDGRGHALDRKVGGHPYMRLVYTHLDYPFDGSDGTPVQLHTIGLSFINTLCSELVVTVQRQGAHSQYVYRDGGLVREEALDVVPGETGNVVAGMLNDRLQRCEVDVQRLREWLGRVASCTPGLSLYFNDALMSPTMKADQANAGT